mmetsp:Transcript_13253/g.37399  ORF Transcript_13253/g.37399 Transcript_13253/m.37399 type:complete len:248 (+) Transcript_13253:1620-2363(+)
MELLLLIVSESKVKEQATVAAKDLVLVKVWQCARSQDEVLELGVERHSLLENSFAIRLHCVNLNSLNNIAQNELHFRAADCLGTLGNVAVELCLLLVRCDKEAVKLPPKNPAVALRDVLRLTKLLRLPGAPLEALGGVLAHLCKLCLHLCHSDALVRGLCPCSIKLFPHPGELSSRFLESRALAAQLVLKASRAVPSTSKLGEQLAPNYSLLHGSKQDLVPLWPQGVGGRDKVQVLGPSTVCAKLAK